MRALLKLLLVLVLFAPSLPAEGKAPCHAPDAVCAAASRVFRIASFDPLASAVLIELSEGWETGKVYLNIETE